MGSPSAILRRWISTSRVLSSRGISLYLRNSCCQSDANRLMSTATTGSSEPPSPPWLMLPPAIDGSGNIAYRFHSLANKEELTHTNKLGGGGESDKLQLPADINDVAFVGSSHGWLALYNRRNSDLFLSNPIADRHIKLPPLHTLGAADRVILSSSLSSDEREEEEEEEEEEEDPIAFMISGSRRRVAFCSPRRSHEWTLLGGEDRDLAYDNLAYSSRHNRLFCISQESLYEAKCVLECWDVHHNPHQPQPPSLDWEYEHRQSRSLTMSFPRPTLSEFKMECSQMRYIVCAQHSGELFLVVRHVNPRAGPLGSLLDKVVLSRDRGCHYSRTPYKTIDFDVYKIDFEGRAVVYMNDSLEGLAMFVGINNPFAIPAVGVPGLKANSVYFTDENRLVEPTRLERVSYGGHDNGIFDYEHRSFYHQDKNLYPCCDFYPIEYDKIRKILPPPLCFTPT